MFTVLRLRQAIAKTSKCVFSFQVREYLPKKNSSVLFRSHFRFWQPSIKKIQNSKLTPEGYEVIYVSPIYYHLNIGHMLLWLSWPTVIAYVYYNLRDPEWYDRKFQFLHSTKGVVGLILLTIPISLHWFLLKNVRLIFRKQHEYKSLIYGLFGPFRKIYIHHGQYAYEKRELSFFFHILKNRRVIIFKDNFQDELDYYGLIVIQDNDRSYQ